MSVLANKFKARTYPHRDVTICLDGELNRRREEALTALASAQRSLAQSEEGTSDERLGAPQKNGALLARVDAAIAAVNAIESEMRAASITLRFTGISHGRWNALIVKNPARKGHQEMFNPTTFFMQAAKETGQYVDESGEVKDLSDDDWKMIQDSITDGEYQRICNAVYDANRNDGIQELDFLSRNSDRTQLSSETSAQPANEG